MRADAQKNRDRLLTIAGDLLASAGEGASLRDIARTAGVGLGTLYRHFPTREALLEALLRDRFDALTVRAAELAATGTPGAALASWLRETVRVAHDYGGAIRAMVAAIEDERSALHAACVTMKAAGARLLAGAQASGEARTDMDGADLFALIGALSWIGEQQTLAPRSDRLLAIVADAILLPVRRGEA